MNNIDKENMRQVIIDSPKQFGIGWELSKDITISEKFSALAVSGMGGSALPADLLKIYLDEINAKNPEKNKSLALFQNRSYSLPQEAYKECLNFFISYSGNTEETISSLEESLNKNIPSVGLASGGKILEICQEKNIPVAILPAGIQPRCATGYIFSAMLRVLANSQVIADQKEALENLSQYLDKINPQLEEQGKAIAEKLTGKTPVIYAPDNFRALAMIWKIKFNENAKTPAFYNFYPELNHNEMVGYTLPQGKFCVINLIDREGQPQNIRRAEITARLLQDKNIETIPIEISGSNMLEKIFSTLLLGDWASYYLAINYGQDPTPVAMVEDLKKSLT